VPRVTPVSLIRFGALAWGFALALCLTLAGPARAVTLPDTIGLFRPDAPAGTNTFFLRNANSLGPPANTIAGFGANGDEAVIGDWNGDGITTIGVFRSQSPAGTNTFFLRDSNTLGPPDITIEGIGVAGDLPIVGDWDGNGTTTIGLFRPNSPPGSNTFFLWNSNTLGPPDITIEGIGVAGDLPIVGDWDGTGTTTIGLLRSNSPPGSNTFFLWNSNTLGQPDITVAGVGASGDVPIAGDWDGTGTTTIGLFRQDEPTGTNTFFLWNTNVLGAPDVTIAGFGAVGDHPVAGQFVAAGGVSLTTLGTAYTQNFDTLPSFGSATWTNDATIPGWYHARTGTGTTIVANDGTNNAGNLYCYGTGTATDRALGSVGSGGATAGDFFWGVRLVNNTGSTITSLDVSYTGEQWRNGAAAAQTVTFSYLVGSPAVTGSLAEFQSTGVAVPSLDFTSPITGGVAGALNGNLAANRTVLTFSITGLSIPTGTEVMLRWSDPDHAGVDHGLAIDDFSVTPN
jgi:hypothetical protein